MWQPTKAVMKTRKDGGKKDILKNETKKKQLSKTDVYHTHIYINREE
jgi:hypothetical protein